MKEKVIFDTNFLFNKVASSFFGNREELTSFSSDVDIILPEIVLEELEAKYIRIFEDDKGRFVKTLLSNIVEHNTNEIIIENSIKELINNENIPYTVIELKDYSILPEIKKLAIKKQSPFEVGEGTDKGFKDAYIYFTILEFIQNLSDKYVFVCSKDKRFKKAFEVHPNIISIESYEDFKKHSILYYFDDYFVQKINEVLGLSIIRDNIKEYWYNLNENKVVLVEYDGQEFVVETDSGEIINSCNRSSYIAEIGELVNSNSFRQTHRTVKVIAEFVDFLSNNETIKILEASYRNPEIRRIIKDYDVKQFIGNLFDAKKDLITDEEALSFLIETFE
ncbi:MAG: PIN domain-containing protein [Flavobacterium sp.]|nr:PIN domain-containing protein [Flavobacterium sp.]